MNAQIENPDAAILMAVWNGERYLEEQLNSFANQTVGDFTVYIGLDPSIDSSENIIFRFMDKHPDITIRLFAWETPSGGAAANFFRLFRVVGCSSHKFYCLCDQDDVWVPDKIEIVNGYIDRGYSGVSSNVILFGDSIENREFLYREVDSRYRHLFNSIAPGCTFAINAELFGVIRGKVCLLESELVNVYFHDWFIYSVACSNDHSWAHIAQPLVLYRQHANNVFGANSGCKAKIGRLSRIVSGWYRNQAIQVSRCAGFPESDVLARLSRFNTLDRFFFLLFPKRFRPSLIEELVIRFGLLLQIR